jgi:hypothetical protein
VLTSISQLSTQRFNLSLCSPLLLLRTSQLLPQDGVFAGTRWLLLMCLLQLLLQGVCIC